MLIINADDWGLNERATDNSLLCYKNGSITSVSAMMFMADSDRAAELAMQYGLNVGLHLNFTLEFEGNVESNSLTERQRRIATFLRTSKYLSVLYNFRLRADFKYVYEAQYDEFRRLYNKKPTHIDGHHHMHLCTNILVDKLIPRGSKVRRNFTLSSGEKNLLNRFYRYIVDSILTRRYICTDYFFSILPNGESERLQRIVEMSILNNVELMVHPGREEELYYLLSDDFAKIISSVEKISYASL